MVAIVLLAALGVIFVGMASIVIGMAYGVSSEPTGSVDHGITRHR